MKLTIWLKQEIYNFQGFIAGMWQVIKRGTVVVNILWKGAKVTHCNYGPVVHTQQSLAQSGPLDSLLRTTRSKYKENTNIFYIYCLLFCLATTWVMMFVYFSWKDIVSTPVALQTPYFTVSWNISLRGICGWRSSGVGWDTMLQAGRSRVLVLPAALWPWGRLSL
jgi:hypothetical protein